MSNLTNLAELKLNGNRISDIRPLAKLTNLTTLELESNQIADISSLVNNFSIGENTVVELEGNPLNDESYDIHIPALQERNVEVHFDSKP